MHGHKNASTLTENNPPNVVYSNTCKCTQRLRFPPKLLQNPQTILIHPWALSCDVAREPPDPKPIKFESNEEVTQKWVFGLAQSDKEVTQKNLKSHKKLTKSDFLHPFHLVTF